MQKQRKPSQQLVIYSQSLLGLAQYHRTHNRWRISTWGMSQSLLIFQAITLNVYAIESGYYLQLHINSCISCPYLQYHESNNGFINTFGLTGILLAILSNSLALTQPNLTTILTCLLVKPPQALVQVPSLKNFKKNCRNFVQI